MIRLGEKQTLVIVKKVEFGVYLAASEKEAEDRVLLPARQVPENSGIGDELEVFVYRDSKDRLIATTRTPKLMMGQVAELKVAQTGKFGAFLDWGLEKDLMLPFKQQTRRVREGEDVLVSLYIDKSSRLCATMNVYPDLKTNSPYHKDDSVTGRVYQTSDNFGAFVAVDNKYYGLIPKQELFGSFREGEEIQARVMKVREDGKLDLCARDKAYIQMSSDADKVLKVIDEFDGVLPFNDKAKPEVIMREFNMSKNAFKRAVGRLLKEGKVKITEKTIERI